MANNKDKYQEKTNNIKPQNKKKGWQISFKIKLKKHGQVLCVIIYSTSEPLIGIF